MTAPADDIQPDRLLAEASHRPGFAAAAGAFMAGRLGEAERGARMLLARDPDDPAALLLLAEIADRAGVPREALALLRRAAALLPDHVETETRVAELLFRTGEARAALERLDKLLARDPRDARVLAARVGMLADIGEYDRAESDYRQLTAERPETASAWVGYANLLRTLGRAGHAEAAFRRALALSPQTGEAWWGLADLKSGVLTDGDAGSMRELLARGRPDAQLALHLHFALGRVAEEAARWEESFRHYDEANRIGRALRPWSAAAASEEIDRTIALLTPDLLNARQGVGERGRGPIFVVGMPRAGSTLVEQMLASHPLVEGTAELPYVPQLAHELLAERWGERALRYPEVLAELPDERFAELGRRYLERASAHRRSDRPFFIDKLNDNWPHVGLIHLMLPDAVVVDARRGAMACGFGNFKQHYARGRDFAYRQGDIARRYADYVRLMDHVDRVLPGRVHRVTHERLVAEPEAELRALLDHAGLPFDPACLRFHENARPVRTASAAQVRRPLDRGAAELWRNYRPWLGEMERALGPLAEG